MSMSSSIQARVADVPERQAPGVRERWYPRDALIRLERDAVLEVRAGVVALTIIHADGTEVLLGLHGPGQVLIGHPEDGCCL